MMLPNDDDLAKHRSGDHSACDPNRCRVPWVPPEEFRTCLATVEQLAATVVAELEASGSLLIQTNRVEFLMRRLQRLSRDLYDALPEDVD